MTCRTAKGHSHTGLVFLLCILGWARRSRRWVSGYWRSRLASSVDVSLLSPKNQGKPLGKYYPKRGPAEKTSHPPPFTQACVPQPGPRVLPRLLVSPPGQGLANYSTRGMWAGRAQFLGDQRCFFISTLLKSFGNAPSFTLESTTEAAPGFLWCSRAFGSPGISLNSREHCSGQQETERTWL